MRSHTKSEGFMIESRSKFIALRRLIGAGSHSLSHCSKDPENELLFPLWIATDDDDDIVIIIIITIIIPI